ncbi:MAG: hypothetical protein IKA87_05880 [Lentisphaeria bacterium]|nr:hypothetical protein [Lentisphaeria bacterium]
MNYSAKKAELGRAAFRLLFTSPDRNGSVKVRENDFLQLLHGVVELEENVPPGGAAAADYFNEIFRRYGSGASDELLCAFFDSFTAAGITPELLRSSIPEKSVEFLLRESMALIDFLGEIRSKLPEFGLLSGAAEIFSKLESLSDSSSLQTAIAGADRFLQGRVFRFVCSKFEAVKADSAKDVEKFFGFPGVRSSFQDHFQKFREGVSNIPLLIHSLPGYGKTSMTVSYALAEKDVVLILPDPEALESGWYDLMEPLTARKDLKFVVFFDDIDPRSVNWYKFRTHVGGAFTLPENVNVVLSANYEFPPSILSRGRRVSFPVFDEIRCMEMVEDFLHDFGLKAIPGNLVSLIAADYTEEFGQHKFTELSPRTLMRYLDIYQKSTIKRRNIVELAMGPMITRPDPELFYEFNIELMRSLYGEEYIKQLLKERLKNL